jgi:uncharacterized SAM-binding protein YcdF (DUF218 family)
LFFLRKLIVALLAPSLWGYAALVAGVVMLLFARTRRAGRVVLAAGAVWLVLLSLGIPFDAAGRWLEGRHAPLLDPVASGEAGGVEWVVVLGGGHRADARLPVSAHLPEQALYRAVEGVRLQRALPGSRLLFVGFGGIGRAPAAAVGARLAAALGVDPAAIVADGAPRTTGEEAEAVRALAGGDPVILVTTAVHMPRSVRLFERAGVTVIPAPTGHVTSSRRSVGDWIKPRPDRLAYADAVAHELFGLAWGR